MKIAIASILLAFNTLAFAKSAKNKVPTRTCTTYYIDLKRFFEESQISRPTRIDSIIDKQRCVNIAGFLGGTIGATFCVGDVFDTGVIPLYSDEDRSNEVGLFTRTGTRVPGFGEGLGPYGNVIGALVFKDATGDTDDKDQLYWASVDLAGSTVLTGGITGGTGVFEGAAGTVKLFDAFSKTNENIPVEVCVRGESKKGKVQKDRRNI